MYYQPDIQLSPEDVIVYLRKSRSDDPILTVEEVLHKHETILDEWCERYLHGRVPEENKYREVVSGETIDDRPEMLSVLKKIESPKCKAIAVVEVQRLSRGDLEDAGRLIKLLRYTNTLVITPQKTYDLRDEYDRDGFERELKRGNEFLEYQKKIMNRGRLLSVSQGNYIGSVPPYGYSKVTIMDGKRKCPTLQIKPDEADVVRMIFDMYVIQDMGRDRICRKLDELGIKPPKGGYWAPSAIKDMLTNVHYIGKVKWNWRKTLKVVEDSEVISTRPKAKVGEFLIYDGKHDPIISEELFNAAQEKHGKNIRVKTSVKVRNPFAGLVYCQCGKAVLYRPHKNYASGEQQARMLCSDQVHCNTGSCLYGDFVALVSNILEDCIADFEVRMQNDSGNSIELHKKLVKQLEAKKKTLEAKELAQWEAQADPDPSNRMPQAIFQKLNEKLLREKEEVQQALCAAYESMPEPVDYQEKVVTFREALDVLRDPQSDPQKANKLLRKCIERITYHREKPTRNKRSGPRKRITVDGKRVTVKELEVGGSWTATEMELDVKLRV